MKNIAENTYDFEELRKSGAVYVDKTGMLHDLIVNPGRKLYFVARPRRFGKSLMISTLRAIFDGRRDLFDGLAIAGKEDFEWQKWPVIQFDFSDVKTGSLEEFKNDFAVTVAKALGNSGQTYDYNLTPGKNFADAIQSLYKDHDNGVVVLIDEYDAPIGHAFGDLKLADAIRNEMSNFYIQIKKNEKYIRFMMMTGVSQFAKMSVFSALSNLSDMSLDAEVATLLGYTEDELHLYFDEHMHAHADVMGIDFDEYMNRLRKRCDGYLFSGKVKTGGVKFKTPEEKAKAVEEKLNAIRVYNPVAVGINLAKRNEVFESSWANTGRASVLVNYLRREELAELDYEKIVGVYEDELISCPLDFLPAITVLYQSGYLTIKGFDVADNLYTLGVPNDEVREDLSRMIVFSQKGETDSGKHFRQIRSALVEARFDDAKPALQSYFAEYVYGSKEMKVCEAAYARSLKTVLEASGFKVQAEVNQAQGRADLVVRCARANFVFELKVNDPVELAIDQIREKNYTLPYQMEDAPLYAIGLTFDSATRNVKDLQAVRVK